MKEHLGEWVRPNAEARFRSLESELWAEHLPGGLSGDAVDVDTTFGPTRAYRWSGDPDRPPVVLLHGIGGTSLMWAPYVGGFDRPRAFGTHTIIAVDTMGDAGRSQHRRPFTGPDDYARWLDETLEALAVDRAHVVGTSHGAWIALNQAVRRPQRVASATLVEPTGIGPLYLRGFFRWGGLVMLASFLPFARLRRRAGARLGMPAVEFRGPMRLVRIGQLGHRYTPEQDPFTVDELRSVEVPVIVLVGERSSIHDAAWVADHARQVFATVHAEVVPGATHGLVWSHLDEVTAAWAQVDMMTDGDQRPV